MSAASRQVRPQRLCFFSNTLPYTQSGEPVIEAVSEILRDSRTRSMKSIGVARPLITDQVN